MKIAFDAKRAFWNNRGLGNYSRDVIRLLATYAPANEYFLCGVPNRQRETLLRQGTVVAPEGWWKYLPSLWRSGGMLSQLQGMDVYHGLSGELPWGIEKTGIKSVVTMHDAIFVRYPELYSPTYRWLFTKKVQYACNVADIIIAISEQTKRDLVEFFHADEKKIRVVYQGCSNIFRELVTERQIAEVRRKYALPDCYLLDVGAIEPRKNMKNLLRAMAVAGVSLPLVAIGGKSRYADEMAAEAKRLGVDLRMLHNVPFADFPAIYKAAEVMCYPSIFEGFGIPVLEAMCVDTPVLTSTGSCFAETGGDAALYADPLNPKEIGTQLLRILTEDGLRKEMIQKGQEQAARFTDERVAANLIKIYEELR